MYVHTSIPAETYIYKNYDVYALYIYICIKYLDLSCFFGGDSSIMGDRTSLAAGRHSHFVLTGDRRLHWALLPSSKEGLGFRV